MYSKQIIENKIEQYKEAIQVKEHVQEVMKKFKHYKQVNKRFIDALKENGEFHAWITKDNYSTTFTAYKNKSKWGYNDRKEIRVYCSEVLGGEGLTWEKIEESFKSYNNFEDSLQELLDMQKAFDEELKQLKELVAHINKHNFKCFSLSEIKYKLKDMLKVAEKQND